MVQSRQNVATSESSGWNASVTVGPTGITGFSFGGSQADANRVYTDTPTTIIAENTLDIYTEGTTYLLGAVLDSKVGDLTLNTGDFIFQDYIDADESESISGGIKIGLDGNGVSSLGTTGFGYAYTDIDARTYATVGTGEITVRNVANGEAFDFALLNRDVDLVQEILSNESFEIDLPAIELSAWIEHIQEATEFLEGLADDMAQENGIPVDFGTLVTFALNEEIVRILLEDHNIDIRELEKTESTFARYLRDGITSKLFRSLGELNAIFSDGPVAVGTDENGETQILSDNLGRLLYINKVTGLYFFANPNDLRDKVIVEASIDIAGLATTGTVFTPTRLPRPIVGIERRVEVNASRYSGILTKVNNPDQHADALASRLGGESRVRFANDPNSREFDVVSAEYIGQAKPGTLTVGSSFRSQAKATFEAAQATGRNVYYHFDSPPSQIIVSKLNEYSVRYNVPVVIDTTPL